MIAYAIALSIVGLACAFTGFLFGFARGAALDVNNQTEDSTERVFDTYDKEAIEMLKTDPDRFFRESKAKRVPHPGSEIAGGRK